MTMQFSLLIVFIAGATAQPRHDFGIAGLQNATKHASRGGQATCVSGHLPIEASTSENLKLDFRLPKNQIEVTEVFTDFTSSGSTLFQDTIKGTQEIHGAYDIAVTVCTPTNNPRPEQVQFLTHGLGFDGYYWDFVPEYSWVDVAAQYGHASVFYDRLGTGKSATPDALNVVQAPLEVEIAHQLIRKLNFPKIVGVGHSFGSALTLAISSRYPSDLDGVVLTGFSANATAQQIFFASLNIAIASQNNPSRFGSLSPGYFVWSTPISNQLGFFRAPTFDPAILQAAEATKAPATWGEFFSGGSLVGQVKNYSHPVAIINGENDLPACYGNCTYPIDLAEAALHALYPNASKHGTYLAPKTGHGLNLHFTALEAYQYAQEFITANV